MKMVADQQEQLPASNNATPKSPLVGSPLPRLASSSSLIGMILVTAVLAVWKRQALGGLFLFIKNEWLLQTLDALSAAGPKGLVAYTLMLLVWEMTVGITTPIETAAGAAFGILPGILASGMGKLLGAYLAFWLARTRYADKVQQHVLGDTNELLALLGDSSHESPLRVALLSRFLPLPELVKNAGLGVLLQVPKRWFLTSLVLHGFTFTCLWTCVGAETARILRGGGPPSATLKILLTGVTWIGFGAPVGIGMWIKSLKDKQQQTQRRLRDEAQPTTALASEPNKAIIEPQPQDTTSGPTE
jgi:uncharacterized membrane protein YdjX (TVP38/TMEM64 family)